MDYFAGLDVSLEMTSICIVDAMARAALYEAAHILLSRVKRWSSLKAWGNRAECLRISRRQGRLAPIPSGRRDRWPSFPANLFERAPAAPVTSAGRDAPRQCVALSVPFPATAPESG